MRRSEANRAAGAPACSGRRCRRPLCGRPKRPGWPCRCRGRAGNGACRQPPDSGRKPCRARVRRAVLRACGCLCSVRRDKPGTWSGSQPGGVRRNRCRDLARRVRPGGRVCCPVTVGCAALRRVCSAGSRVMEPRSRSAGTVAGEIGAASGAGRLPCGGPGMGGRQCGRLRAGACRRRRRVRRPGGHCACGRQGSA